MSAGPRERFVYEVRAMTLLDWETAGSLYERLLAAGLLATPESFEVMGRLTDGVRKALATRGGLLGQRIGLASDFPCNREHATPALLECGEAWTDYHACAGLREWDNGFGKERWNRAVRATTALLAEREAARPKPRWTVKRNGDVWFVSGDKDAPDVYGTGYDFTEPQARAIADALNALEVKP